MIEAFQKTVWDHYRVNGRDLPWRRTRDAYAILVSETMLQQTQVVRVLDRYERFLARFPTVEALAAASVAEVVSAWQGLGYNRRALALREAARVITARHAGKVPDSPTELRLLPGVGPATAAAVCAFAYDLPLPFIETNIRAAFIHFFFPDRSGISDSELLPLVESTLDRADPRRWYYALMDYGVWVKKHHVNPGRRSRHYARQAAFAGSRRQLRAAVLQVLLSAAPRALEVTEVQASSAPLGADTSLVRAVLEELAGEGFLTRDGRGYRVA